MAQETPGQRRQRRKNSRGGPNRNDEISQNKDAVTSSNEEASQANSVIKEVPQGNGDLNVEERIERAKRRKQKRTYRYPQDIDSEIQPHSMVFNILERIPSNEAKAIRSGEAPGALYSDSSENRVNAEQGAGLFSVATAQAVALGTAGGVAALATGKALGGGGASGVLKTAVGLGGFALGANALNSRTGLIKTNTIIQLYIPQSLSTKYGAQWQDTELGTIGGAITQVGPGTTSLDEFLKSAGGAGEAIGRGLIGVSDIFKQIGLNVDFGGTVQALTKKVVNPFKEQLFKTMNFRDFAFEWKFAPRNRNELENVMQIIDTFKYHMHSGRDTSDFFLTYPSEFQIEFRYRGAENRFVNKISTCALTDMKVDYGAGGSFTTFKDVGGAPSEITMQLAFKELELMTKDRIEQGY